MEQTNEISVVFGFLMVFQLVKRYDVLLMVDHLFFAHFVLDTFLDDLVSTALAGL